MHIDLYNHRKEEEEKKHQTHIERNTHQLVRLAASTRPKVEKSNIELIFWSSVLSAPPPLLPLPLFADICHFSLAKILFACACVCV